ncbi:MAG: cyclic nucleotide-binding and patatin-like phospholipase domain-containing protein [Planctomycetota bacterium]
MESSAGAHSPHEIDRQDVAEFLATTQLFGGVDATALRAFAEAFVLHRLRGGATFEAEGLETDSLYVVRRGRVKVQFTDVDGDVVQFVPGRAKFFGELNLLAAEPRLIHVKAVRDSELLRMSRSALREVATRFPDALWTITQAVVARMGALLRGDTERSSRVTNLAVIPITEDRACHDVTESLARALSTLGRTTRVGPREARERFGPDATEIGWDHERNADMSAWLGDLELDHEFVVVEGRSVRDEWTLRCVRQAERILVVAPPGVEPDLDALRAQLRVGDRCCVSDLGVEVLVFHPSDAEYGSGGSAWREHAAVERIYQARLGNARDFERTARCLVDRAVGVVLGGGGARGIAQVGALQALEDAGIPVDVIGGTSIGSIFGGGYAMGWSAARIMENVRRIFSKKKALIDVTFPYVALLSGGKLTDVLTGLYGEKLIEDLWHDFFCVSVSLNSANVNVHDRGTLWHHVRSSVALPGIFPPVHVGDDVLIDGGVMNNLPTDIMVDYVRGGTVIAVDVSGAGAGAGASFDSTVSGWRELRSRLNPFGGPKDEKMISIFDVLLGSTVVASRSKRNRKTFEKETSLYVRPAIEGFGLMEFERYEELHRIGYEGMQKSLETWERP